MIMRKRVCSKLFVLLGMALFIGSGFAQNIDKFTVTGEMAKKALVRGEINVATAEKLNQVCVEFAKQRHLEVANVILAPSGEIVYAYRMDGQRAVSVHHGNGDVEGQNRSSAAPVDACAVQRSGRKR